MSMMFSSLYTLLITPLIKYNREFSILVFLGILTIITTLVLMHIDYNKHDNIISRFSKWLWYTCGIPTRGNPVLVNYSVKTKSKDYISHTDREQNDRYIKSCLMTGWHVVHFLGHLIGAFLFPMFWIHLLLGTTAFEVYEYFSCNCHDFSDIVYNITGVAIGYFLRMLLFPWKK